MSYWGLINPFYLTHSPNYRGTQLALRFSATTALLHLTNLTNAFDFVNCRKLRPFRSGNKKPMPTHVVKTSESPPQLRRTADALERDREAFQEVPFQRSHKIRASMQEVSSSRNGFGYRNQAEDSFARNTRYRSTMGGTTDNSSAVVGSPVYKMRPG